MKLKFPITPLLIGCLALILPSSINNQPAGALTNPRSTTSSTTSSQTCQFIGTSPANEPAPYTHPYLGPNPPYNLNNDPVIMNGNVIASPQPTSIATWITAFDIARANEGVCGLELPSNFSSLNLNLQEFVLVNLERTARGLAPYVGYDSQVAVSAQNGVNAGIDPYPGYGGNESNGAQYPFEALFGYMYDDGWGSNNSACTSPTSTACWGHRENILYASPQQLGYASNFEGVMGAAYSGPNCTLPTSNWICANTSAMAFGIVEAPDPNITFTWADELPYLPACEQVGDTCPIPPLALNAPAVSMASSGNGYWIASADGQVQTFGGAQNYGELLDGPVQITLEDTLTEIGAVPFPTLALQSPIVAIAATPDKQGYWLVAANGGVFSFGNANFYSSMGGITLNKPVVGMASTPDGGGYWLVAADGGIFSFGDARFYGSTGSMVLNKPVVGMASTPDGGGYWLVAADGGIFSFGDARFYGSTGSMVLNKPVVGMASTPDGAGYWLVAGDGGLFSFGDSTFYGSAPYVS